MDSNGQNLGLHYEGVLEKAGKRFFEGFRKRWFILEGKDLSYYKAAETTEQNLLGIIDLTKVKSVVPFKMINNSFQIHTSTRTYTFTAPSAQLMTEWISVLRQAMQLESFSNKRARSSFRESLADDGYEVVSRSSRSDSRISGTSHKSFDNDDVYDDSSVYDQIQSSGSQKRAENKSADQVEPGTYESVGSFKRKNTQNKNDELEDFGYGIVGGQGALPPSDQGSGEPDISTYDAIGRSNHPQPQDEINLYSTVVKRPIDSPPLYAEVGNTGSTKPSKPVVPLSSNPMPVLVESDVDEEDEEDEEDDKDDNEASDSPDEVKTNGLSEDPLPPPIGSIYAADEIKSLLHKVDGHVDNKSGEKKEISYKDDSPIPESCENAFSELKKFLVYLETSEH